MVAGLLGGFRDWLGYDDPDDESLRRSIERLAGDPGTEYLLGGAPDGVAQLRFRHSVWTGRDDAWLEDLFVAGHARGSGLGRALTDFAMERARARGCARLQLDVNAANTAAKALYESLGFSARQDHLGGDALYMTRNLA